MPRTQPKPTYESVAEYMRATGLEDKDLAKLLDCDISEACRLRNGRKFRSLRKPMRVAEICKVPLEKLVA